MNQLPSLILAVVAIISNELCGNHRRAGWMVGAVGEIGWLAYAIAFHQYGFILMVPVFTAQYLRNWWKWRHLTT